MGNLYKCDKCHDVRETKISFARFKLQIPILKKVQVKNRETDWDQVERDRETYGYSLFRSTYGRSNDDYAIIRKDLCERCAKIVLDFVNLSPGEARPDEPKRAKQEKEEQQYGMEYRKTKTGCE